MSTCTPSNEKLVLELMVANQTLRTFSAVIDREGLGTDWRALRLHVREQLQRQQSLLEPMPTCCYPACSCPTEGEPCGARIQALDQVRRLER